MARWNGHVNLAKRSNGKRSHFAAAIRLHGKDAFSHEVLEVCCDLQVANLAEECWIEFFDTRNPEKGFNLMRGGLHVPHPNRNFWTPELRQMASEHMKAVWADPVKRARKIAASNATVQSSEFRAKIGSIMKEIALRPGVKERRIAASKEVTSRPEVLAKISAAARRTVTHCKYGHSLADAYVTKQGWQQCRVCRVRRCKS